VKARPLAVSALGVVVVLGACTEGTTTTADAPTSSAVTASASAEESAEESRTPRQPSGPLSASGEPSASQPGQPGQPGGATEQGEPGEPTGPALRERGAAALAGGWGPSARQIRRAQRIAARMPLTRLAGQVIVAQYDGRTAPSDVVNGLGLGGVIVMSDNIGGLADLRRSNRALQRSAREAGRRWPVFIGVDQEGGIVERVQGRATRFPAFMSAGAARDRGLTRRAAAASGAELAHLGFSVVFAPSGDVTSGPEDPTIGSRSAGSRPRLVARQMTAAVEGYLSAGLLPVIKHFPGHGSVSTDSHVELPVQHKTLRRLRETDLVPFRAGVAAGVPSVMAAHIDVRAVDPGVPSSLSRKVVHGLLRRDLGFAGLVVSDAMNMGAVTDRHGTSEAAVRALRAGVDVVLMPPSPLAARDGIVAAVRRGRLSRSRLEHAAARQVALLLHQRRLDRQVVLRPGEGRAASYRLSAGAVTVVSGPCRGRLVGSSVRGSGSPETVAAFHRAAARAGLGTGTGTSVAFVGYRGGGRSADVVVTTDTPYALARSSGRVARIATYGDTPGAMRALVEVLLGRSRASGRLPVAVPGVPRTGC
jgi:beta-N-acetylhexosaminidase